MAAIRLMWSLIVATNGTWLEAGMTNSVFPPAFAFASNAAPGGVNCGTARYLSRFAFAPATSADVDAPARAAVTIVAVSARAAARVSTRFWISLARVAVPTPARGQQAEPVSRRCLAIRELRRQLLLAGGSPVQHHGTGRAVLPSEEPRRRPDGTVPLQRATGVV